VLTLQLPRSSRSPLRLLCLGAHSDDIEIGCGGTILRLLAERRKTEVDWVVLSATSRRALEARRGARLFLKASGDRRVTLQKFSDGFFPSESGRIKRYFERLKRKVSPDLIFCPFRNDAHQDHRLIAELVWNTFRDHLILEYEIPKYDGDLGSPNLYVPLSRLTCQEKIAHLRTAFRSQWNRQWFSEDTFWSLLRLRGIESNSPTSLAEGFYCHKAVL
jgi:LmbE family N-acetylglucosaminyl deacetylase